MLHLKLVCNAAYCELVLCATSNRKPKAKNPIPHLQSVHLNVARPSAPQSPCSAPKSEYLRPRNKVLQVLPSHLRTSLVSMLRHAVHTDCIVYYISIRAPGAFRTSIWWLYVPWRRFKRGKAFPTDEPFPLVGHFTRVAPVAWYRMPPPPWNTRVRSAGQTQTHMRYINPAAGDRPTPERVPSTRAEATTGTPPQTRPKCGRGDRPSSQTCSCSCICSIRDVVHAPFGAHVLLQMHACMGLLQVLGSPSTLRP